MIGKTISHYRILEKLGSGGMGVVYMAEDTRLKRLVALKFLPEELVKSPQGLERFQREARAASALNHPHICTIHDIDEAEGRPFIAMELLEGASLRARIQGRPLPIGDILDLGVQLADALDAAHAKRLLHRDIKPENIFISPRGTAKLLDFGIAKFVAEQTDETIPTITLPNWVTAPGMAVGTVAYMSPEQVRGEPLDARTDLFSFGVVLYEMATGMKPFSGATSGAVCTEIQTKAPTAPVRLNPDIPGELERIINKALEKDARLRYQSAKDILVDLERLRRSLASGMPALGRPAEQASIAVLPFENLSPDPDNAFFADGLTEELIADLSKVQSLRVISRTSAMMYKGVKKSAPAIAQELGVRYILEGSVRRAGNSLRITAQLIDSSTDAHLWAEKYTGTLEDVFELQEKLSQRIVEGLRLKLTPKDLRRLAAHTTTDPRVYEIWLRARQEGWKVTAEGVREAIRLTSQALNTFGDDALLHAADGVFHYLAYDFGFSHSEETLVRIEASASRALELNPELALAWYSKGLGRYKHGDMLGFVQNMRHAVGLERNSETLFFLAFALAEIGRIDEARTLADESIERDPLQWTGQLAQSVVEIFDGRFDVALARFKGWTKDVPDLAFAQWWLGQALAYAGKEDEAIAVFEHGARSGPGVLSELCELGALSLRGEKRSAVDLYKSKESLRKAASSDETFPRYLAMCFARIKEYDLALRWLEQAIQWGFTNHRFLSEHDRFLAPLRGDRRFEALMERAREKQRAFEV